MMLLVLFLMSVAANTILVFNMTVGATLLIQVCVFLGLCVIGQIVSNGKGE